MLICVSRWMKVVGLVAVACISVLATAQDQVMSVSGLSVNLVARPSTEQILPGTPTNVWKYETEPQVAGGPTSPFPVFYLRKGQTFTAIFRNELPEKTSVHWHGVEVPASMDGHPADAIPPGGRYRYTYPILNRAGTYWFHPHPDMTTSTQVAKGLAGVMIVTDPEEQALTLPRGKRDRVLVLQDRVIDANNQLVYNLSAVPGYLGNRILVNGRPDVINEVDTAVYRLRILNGSNARIYKLAWSTGDPMTLIGSDHGLLPAPATRPYVMLAPGERIEVWADFRGKIVGETVQLRSLAFTPGGPTGGGGGLGQGAAFDVMSFNIKTSVSDTITLPATLSTTVPNYQLSDATNQANPRVIPIGFVNNRFTMNGGLFGMDIVAANEYPKLGDVEIWEFRNDTPMIQMAHPMHLHNSPFKILDRTWSPTQLTAVNSMKDGLLDEGLKDTFLLMPGERVRLLHKPIYYTGRFLYHCHNLEHEDMGMMRNFVVVP